MLQPVILGLASHKAGWQRCHETRFGNFCRSWLTELGLAA